MGDAGLRSAHLSFRARTWLQLPGAAHRSTTSKERRARRGGGPGSGSLLSPCLWGGAGLLMMLGSCGLSNMQMRLEEDAEARPTQVGADGAQKNCLLDHR